MPGKVGVKIKAGRNLPVMDRGSDTTDAYVEIKLGNVTQKTDVCRKSLNPQWNTDWFRFELDDAELQDEPLQIRLMDHDTYSANDAIGKVNISLNPLCLENANVSSHAKGTVMSGWIPVFDTMHGIRGEVNVIVKIDLFSDANKFRQSSCGVQFFHSPNIPHGYRAQVIHGFVEELVVNDDPEYQWIDKIRTPRASNEARQVVFLRLSGQVQRKIGLKAINLGANAVIGYTQCFDLEGDVGVVARGIGTAVTLVKIQENLPQPIQDNALIEESELASAAASPGRSPAAVTAAVPDQVKATTVSPVAPAAPTVASPAPTSTATGHTRAESLGGKFLQSPAKNPNSTTAGGAQATTPMAAGNSQKKDNSEICRRSSDSDLSVTPKGNSICVASERLITATTLMRLTGPVKGSLNQENFDMLEYPFLTMTKYPSGFIVHLGATVAARSVKLLERVPNPDEPEVRDSWWKELRMEVRSHARSLGCNVVLGYTEVTAISDDVCVLSATGTAAVINMSYNGDPVQIDGNYSSKKDLIVSSLEDNRSTMKLQDRSDLTGSKEFSTSLGSGPKGATSNTSLHNYRCYMCHVPYSQSSVPFNVKMRKCAICKRGKVPDVLLTTIEIPECLQITGRGSFIQAQVVRAKRDLRSESNAKEISDGLPFLEYELHRLLINKLKAKGMNAIFALKTQVAIGEKMMALIATGTALYLSALPPPSVPKIVAGNSWTDTAKLNELQKSLQETFDRNREIYQLKCFESDMQNGKQSDTDDSEDELPEMDLGAGGKDACVLEIDDIEDLEIITLLMEPVPPDGFCVVNTQSVPGLQDMDVVKNLQMFTQIWRAKLMLGHSIGQFPKHFNRILQTIYFKLRTLIPCAICDLKFNLALPESDEIQLLVIGMALGLGDPSKSKIRRKTFSGSHTDNNNTPQGMNNNAAIKHSDEELIFSLDEDQTMNVEPVSAPPTVNTPPHFSNSFGAHSLRLRRTSPCRTSQFTASFKYSRHLPVHDRYGVDVTPLSYVAGGRIDKYLGNLNFFFIRESTSIRENGGISGFVHSFITEILAVVRAHVNALGGNAMVAFYMTELLLVDNQHKNQGQCLISIGGDVVHVSYFADD